MSKKYPLEVRVRAVRMALDRLKDCPSISVELDEIRRLKRENRDLKQANEILKAALIFFA